MLNCTSINRETRAESSSPSDFGYASAVAVAHAYVDHAAGRGADTLYTRLKSLASLIQDDGERRRFHYWLPAFVRAVATRNLSVALVNDTSHTRATEFTTDTTTTCPTDSSSESVVLFSTEGVRS